MPRMDPRTGAVSIARLDGNAAAGALADVFAVDLTMAEVVCGRCDARGPFAETVAELDDDGVIVLCRSCRHTLLTYVSRGGRSVLELVALRSIGVARSE